MGKKRKSGATRLDEVDRSMYSSFSGAANSLSQLYTQAMNQQKIVFQAGERHALEKLYQWILRQHEEGGRVTAADIVTHIQSEIDYGGEDPSMSPRLQFQHQYPPTTTHFTNLRLPPSSGVHGQSTVGLAPRSDQTRSSVFSNALASPVRKSLQPYHLAHGGAGCCQNGVLPHGNGVPRNHEVSSADRSGRSNSSSSNDTAMEMNHAD